MCSCARIRGVQGLRLNSKTGSARLDGLVPMIEDWHTGVCFMQVYYYYTKLIMQHN